MKKHVFKNILSMEEFINEKRITPEIAKKLNYKTDLPRYNIFTNAVGNTDGAVITEDGLEIDVIRFQKSEQSGEKSIRTGVFYLPKSDKNVKYYKKSKTGYGGDEQIT